MNHIEEIKKEIDALFIQLVNSQKTKNPCTMNDFMIEVHALLDKHKENILEEMKLLDKDTKSWSIADIFEHLAFVYNDNLRLKLFEIMWERLKDNLDGGNGWELINILEKEMLNGASDKESIGLNSKLNGGNE